MKVVADDIIVTCKNGFVVDILTQNGIGRTLHSSQIVLDERVELSPSVQGFSVSPLLDGQLLVESTLQDDTVYIQTYP